VKLSLELVYHSSFCSVDQLNPHSSGVRPQPFNAPDTSF